MSLYRKRGPRRYRPLSGDAQTKLASKCPHCGNMVYVNGCLVHDPKHCPHKKP